MLFEDVGFMYVTVFGIECLYFEEGVESISGEFIGEAGGGVTSFTFDREDTLEEPAERAECPGEGGLEARARSTC